MSKAEGMLPENFCFIVICFLQAIIELWKSHDRLHGIPGDNLARASRKGVKIHAERTASTGYRPCPHLRPSAGNVRSDFLHWGQLPEREYTGKAGTLKNFNRIDQKHFWRNPQDVLSSATRKWKCPLNNCHRTENNPTSSDCSTPTLDEWSAFATFLADVIEKYASVLEIDNAVSSTNNENRQDTVDTALAAWYNILAIFVPTQWQGLPFHCITYTERGA